MVALQHNRHKLTVCCIMLNSIFERVEMQGHDYDISDGHVGVRAVDAWPYR